MKIDKWWEWFIAIPILAVFWVFAVVLAIAGKLKHWGRS